MSQTVYCVFSGCPYEGTDLVSIHASKEGARIAAENEATSRNDWTKHTYAEKDYVLTETQTNFWTCEAGTSVVSIVAEEVRE